MLLSEARQRVSSTAEKGTTSHFSQKVYSMAALLVVDDDAEVLEVVCAVLSGMGHSVERASGDISALDILDGKPIDLLLTDVMMPGLHGFNLARMAVLRQPEIKVLYFTGYTEYTIERDEGQKFGKLLHKPLTPDELRQEVEAALAAQPRKH
jgi:CheY-like chemotaxis protein